MSQLNHNIFQCYTTSSSDGTLKINKNIKLIFIENETQQKWYICIHVGQWVIEKKIPHKTCKNGLKHILIICAIKRDKTKAFKKICK